MRYNRWMKAWRWIIILCLVGVAVVYASAGDKKQYASLRFKIVRAGKETPVRNASVILHSVKKNGDQDKGGLELKTNADGEASIDGIPYGKVRVQVIAPKYRTYGEDFDINQTQQEIMVKLEKPGEQYSIYK